MGDLFAFAGTMTGILQDPIGAAVLLLAALASFRANWRWLIASVVAAALAMEIVVANTNPYWSATRLPGSFLLRLCAYALVLVPIWAIAGVVGLRRR
jgi:putative Ca2+/H+ antiporter (TMEM165/GDT1 family)